MVGTFLSSCIWDSWRACFVCAWKRLEMFGIHVPRYALVNREFPFQEVDYFVEEDDFVEVHGERFWKPFVEKPVHGKLLSLRSPLHCRVETLSAKSCLLIYFQ